MEVLIGTTVLAMMAALLMSALYTMGRSARAGEARMQHTDSARTVRAFLRRTLSQAVPLTEQVDREHHVLFNGGREELRFVAELPAHRGGGGLQYVALAVRTIDVTPALVLEYRNAWPSVSFSSPEGLDDWERHVLVRHVASVRFSYFGQLEDDSAPRWTEDWTGARNELPELVGIGIEIAEDGDWPPLIVPIRARSANGQPHLVRRSAGGDG